MQQDRGLTLPLEDMENPIVAEMAKEDHGRMMSTGFQVNKSNSSDPTELADS